MKIAISLFLSLTLFSLQLKAQDTIRYKELLMSKRGDYVKVKSKSAVTGGKSKLSLRHGKWEAIDSQGNTLIEVHYKASKSAKFTRKHGNEVFYFPGTTDTILVRTYKKGSLVNQKGFNPGIFDYGGRIIHVYQHFTGFKIEDHEKTNNSPGTRVMFTGGSHGNLMKILNDSNYHLYEDKIGDSQLLTPARYSTKHAYNYISNPEFEKHPLLRSSHMSFTNQVPGWTIASESPDFFFQPNHAKSGNSYVGFRVFSLEKHIEYLQNKLVEPLKKDSSYCFTAFLKLSPGSKYASNAFGFLASEEPLHINTDELLSVEPSKRVQHQILNYKTRWMKVQCNYTAKGGEKYLVLGSFQNHKDLNLVDVGGDVYESYYYLEDVSLVPVSDSTECGCNFSRPEEEPDPETETTSFDTLKKGDKLILDDIHFENDKSELLGTSFKTLYTLLQALQDIPTMEIELSGHTSKIGGYEHNKSLSMRRAEAVKRFLTLNGIAQERIGTIGYGPDQPIADDETEEGQRQNRRVEFKVLKR
jgi:OOP family OmpA-OmpF porin